MNRQEIQLQPSTLVQNPEASSPSALTFEEFANQPEYMEVNRGLIKRLFPHLPNRFFHVDIATGTGLVPKLLMQQSQERGHKANIIGIDPNPISLEIARRTTPQSEEVDVLYLEGFGQDTEKLVHGKISSHGADSVSIHDALHEIEGEENKNAVLIAMRNVLRPSGLFSFNSAFTTFGTEPNARVWGMWKLNALRLLQGKRDKEVTPIEFYTPEHYKKMVESIGLVVVHEAKNVVNLTKDALEGISRYPKFIEGAFGDMIDQGKFTLEQKSQALIDALKGVEFMPRGWYEIIAQKPPVTIL